MDARTYLAASSRGIVPVLALALAPSRKNERNENLQERRIRIYARYDRWAERVDTVG